MRTEILEGMESISVTLRDGQTLDGEIDMVSGNLVRIELYTSVGEDYAEPLYAIFNIKDIALIKNMKWVVKKKTNEGETK